MELTSIIETILFAYGEPMSSEKLAKLTGVKKEDVHAALESLKGTYADRGFVLLQTHGEWQLGSHPENAHFVEKLLKSEFTEELSKAALETLAIIAYKGPLTRIQVEYVRGVNSSFTLRNLLMRGLVERIENPKDARSYLYRITFDFLKHLGLTDIKELPEYQAFETEKIEVLEEISPESPPVLSAS